MPQVSVIIPNYNHSNFLDRRVRSILDQTFTDLELIILDDCSLDNSREVIERYRSEPRVSEIIYNQINSGSTFKQWDKGISRAKGEYIWIAESDDYCEPSFLHELVTPLQNNPDLVLSFCQALFVSPEGEILEQTGKRNLAEYVAGNVFLSRYMLGSNGIPNASMLVFRKSTIKLISEDYKKMKYCGDWLFYSSLALHGRVFISGKYLNYYLRHKQTVTSNALKLGYDFLEGDEVYAFIKKNVQVNDQDELLALNDRIDWYLQIRDNFLNAEVNRQVLESLWGLDKKMKVLFRKRVRIIRLKKHFTKFKNFFLYRNLRNA